MGKTYKKISVGWARSNHYKADKCRGFTKKRNIKLPIKNIEILTDIK